LSFHILVYAIMWCHDASLQSIISAPFQNCQNVEKGFSMLPQISIWHHKIAYTGLWKVTVMWYLYKLPHFVRVGFRHNTELREENKYMTFRRDNPRIRYAIIRLSSIITSCLGLVRAQFYSHKRWTKELMTKKNSIGLPIKNKSSYGSRRVWLCHKQGCFKSNLSSSVNQLWACSSPT